METTSARRLADLVGDLGGDRPPRYAALADGCGCWSPTAGAAGHTAAGGTRAGRGAGAEPRHGHRRLRPAARGRLGHRPPGSGHVRRTARPVRTAARGCPGRWTTARSTWPTPRRRRRRRCRPPSPPRSPSCPATCRSTATTRPGCRTCVPASPSATPPAACRRRPSRCWSPRGRCTASRRRSRPCCAAGSGCWSSSRPIRTRSTRRGPLGARAAAHRAGRRRAGGLAGRRRAGAAPPSGRAAAYLMPDFQNPTGRLLDGAGRERLAAGTAPGRDDAVVDETFAELWLDAPAAAPAGGVRRRAPLRGQPEQDAGAGCGSAGCAPTPRRCSG